jgi:GT2 family glycosyltransferase
MKNWIERVDIEEIFDLLPHNFKQEITKDSLKELDESKSKNLVRKRFYKVRTKNEQFIHLSCGKSLRSTFENSQSLNEILPEITCKPLFIEEGENFSLFAQEYFQGLPVDKAYEKGLISEDGLNQILSKIKREIEKTEKPSTRKDFEKEFEKLKILVLENERLFKFDLYYLELVVFPFIEKNLQYLSFSTRMSNGDLAARNILVDENENFKIIDAEFAMETHFHQEDWLRLAKFSGKDFAESKFLQNQLKAIDPVFEMILNLRQTILNKSVHTEENYFNHTIHDLYNCLWGSKIFKNCKKQKSSLIIEGIRNNINITEKELDIKKEVTNLLQSQLDQERDDKVLLQSQLDQERDDKVLLQTQLDQERDDKVSLQSQLDQERDDKVLLQTQLDQEKNDNNILQISLKGEKKAKLQIEQTLESEKNSRLLIETESLKQKDKILRMQKSVSWKITTPLRFLRRKFLDPRIKLVDTNPKSESEGNSYQDWIKKYDTITDDRITSFRKEFEDLKEKPLFSIIMPVYDPPKQFFEEALQSVITQVYTNWELCISDDRSTHPYIHEIIEEYSKKFPKIKVNINEKHAHISETSNNALKLAKGEYVILMDHDDLLRPHSLLRFAEAISNNKKLKLIYSDEDKIDLKGLRYNPYFKPDWNPDLLLAQNYICHLTCIRKNLVNRIGNFKQGFEGSQDWDLFLRTTETLNDSEILHIPEILYHWRATDSSTATKLSNKNYALESAMKALKEHHNRMKTCGSPEIMQNGYFKTNYCLQKKLKCSIIIPTRNGGTVLERCLTSIYKISNFKEFEILLIDNGSNCSKTLSLLSNFNDKYQNFRIINDDSSFNYSALNNKAVKYSKNDILIFLNDDTEILTPNWLDHLMNNAARPRIGAVGAKLLYPNGTIQHAGVILGIGGVAGHAFRSMQKDTPVQMNRANISQNLSAITGACLAVEKSKFESVMGFDEKYLKVAFNDIDLCLKLLTKGYKNLYLPEVVLKHYESYTRGYEDTDSKKKRFHNEVMVMKKRWNSLISKDPNYNPNLSLFSEQFHYK